MFLRRAARLLPLVLGLLLTFPVVARATTPIEIELSASATSLFRDEPLTLTAHTTPFDAGLTINFELVEGTLAPAQADVTNPNGIARVTLDPIDLSLWDTLTFVASFEGDETYDGATSNEVEVTFNLHPASMTVAVGDTWNDRDVVNTVDFAYIKPRLTADQCIGGFTILQHLEGGGFGLAASGTAMDGVGGQPGVCGADIRLGQLPVGLYSYRVAYDGAGGINEQVEVDPVNLEVALIATSTALSASPSPAEASEPTRLTATLSTDPEDQIQYLTGEGSFTFYEGDEELGTAELQQGAASAWIDVAFPTTGTKPLHATWSGFSTADPSTSPTLNLTVGPNLVHAAGVGVSAMTFYPVVDGYKDTVLAQGLLQETASVAVTISNLSSGSVVRTLSVPEQDAGPYSVAWNGRNVGGNLVAAGSYRIRQVVTDDLGAKLTVDRTVTVSRKELVWHSASKTKSGSDLDAKGKTSGVSFVSSPLYPGGIRIQFPAGTPGRFGALGYEFKMASGVVYKAIKLSVQGSGTKSPVMGLHDKTLGTWPSDGAWVIDYFQPFKAVPKAFGWTGLTGDANANRSGRIVRGMILALDWFSGSYDIAKVRLTYKYATLE